VNLFLSRAVAMGAAQGKDSAGPDLDCLARGQSALSSLACCDSRQEVSGAARMSGAARTRSASRAPESKRRGVDSMFVLALEQQYDWKRCKDPADVRNDEPADTLRPNTLAVTHHQSSSHGMLVREDHFVICALMLGSRSYSRAAPTPKAAYS
jgi:hypothetical protein